jgi:nicotinamide riboside kinase
MSAGGGKSLRIVLTGPECTGKSTLCAHLAQRFNVPAAQEYARIYLDAHGPAYDQPLLVELARGHVAYQQAQVPAGEPLGVLDTDLINYKIWSEVVFGHCHLDILKAVAGETDHAYLLCAPDLPWVPDPLRENPNDRPALFERHRQEIERLGRPYIVIEGFDEARRRSAEMAFRKLTGAD